MTAFEYVEIDSVETAERLSLEVTELCAAWACTWTLGAPEMRAEA
jgi:hypothetical protein